MLKILMAVVVALWFGLIGGCHPDIAMVRRMETRAIDREVAQTKALSADHTAIAKVVAPAAVAVIDANQREYGTAIASSREEAADDESTIWKMLVGLMGTGGLSVFAARKMSGSGSRIEAAERRSDRAVDKFDALKDELLRNMRPPPSGG